MNRASSVGIATTTRERLAIYRLRYDVYIDELSKPYLEANHTTKILTDDLDDAAVHLYRIDASSGIIAALRCNYASDLTSAQRAVLAIDGLGLSSARVTVCSRLVVARKCRRKREVLMPLLLAIYRWGLNRGITVNVIHTAESLVPLFEHLGFKKHAKPFSFAAVNDQQPMCLKLDDAPHLLATKSPFLAELQAWRLQKRPQPERSSGWSVGP